MLTISLWQPWATLWASGHKRIETRPWGLRNKLPVQLAVHAARHWDQHQAALCLTEPYRSVLQSIGYAPGDYMPTGFVVGVVTVTRVFQFTGAETLSHQEEQFGDFSPGRFGWEAGDARLLAEPVMLCGLQGIWNWSPAKALVFAEGNRMPPRQPVAATSDRFTMRDEDRVRGGRRPGTPTNEPSLF